STSRPIKAWAPAPATNRWAIGKMSGRSCSFFSGLIRLRWVLVRGHAFQDGHKLGRRPDGHFPGANGNGKKPPDALVNPEHLVADRVGGGLVILFHQDF